MKNKINSKVKVLIAGIVLMLFNIITPNLDAVQFNVPSKSDSETNKEYTAKLLDLQLDTIMPLSLDEFDDFSDSDNSINVIGSVQINKKIDNDNVKYLDEMPQVYLVDSKDNIISTADIYCQSDIDQVPSDIYYIYFYDLKIENEKEYKILVKINDEDKEISKYVTYPGNIAVSPGNNLSMTYYSNSNILTDREIILIWSVLPLQIKQVDGKLLYSKQTSPDANLETLYEICEKNDKNCTIFFMIETENDEVFGGIMTHNIELIEDVLDSLYLLY